MQGWRTMAFQGLTVVIAWLNTRFDFIDLTGEETAAVVITIIAMVNGVLRWRTTTPLGEKPAVVATK